MLCARRLHLLHNGSHSAAAGLDAVVAFGLSERRVLRAVRHLRARIERTQSLQVCTLLRPVGLRKGVVEVFTFSERCSRMELKTAQIIKRTVLYTSSAPTSTLSVSRTLVVRPLQL